ncbi:zinc finger homeobox protein 3 isoform X2 [Anthonomus grandis grandis]|uniref:zinc finger homeobox protein 3 isoform X2 n=1 Tax=Anthonomus grandis grandis TaxID=2921223 RepID=UPI0021658048|nr:zinc finger homeobox protein 3 isoform X2 [Anthonomus grandis grandis]
MPNSSAAPEPTTRPNAAMSPEQEASPPPAAPGASPPPPPTRLPSPAASTSDVEQFAGKIVYNPDGSAYIIEDSESDCEAPVPAPENGPPLQAVYVSRMLRQPTRPSELPAVHSYRVVALRDARPPRPASLPVKPILMCFVCRLSFGFARSFASHASAEHGVALQDAEREVLAQDCGAILQCVGAEKRPIVSLLEPLGNPINTEQQLIQQQTSIPNRTESMQPPQHPQQTQQVQSTPGKSPSPPFASPPAFMTGTTIGVCPEHLQGRPSGVDCQRCEMILASGRLGPAGLANVHSRNSCKTLKCPKCNWHYKYQETLEIHMKEKHPEAETSCIYCIAGQPHPRLARGETYTCGYKPYRCEVCNYSTTTKGNLSIHMQSDKHLNNMQELQNGGGPNGETRQASPKAPSLHHSPVSSGHKPKPSFRCDVCNYETNVARNLRIHMTSEKHTHNMLVLQQNVKHMQTLSALHHQQHPQQHMESLYGMYPGLGDKPEAALADMAYNQALLIQMMTGGQLPGHAGPAEMAAHSDLGLNPETMEPPPEPADPDPEKTYQCCVCNVFQTDSLEDLGRHLALDRTRLREQEILAVVAGHYVCKLCTYKTNLKANFQLHCKTDKHLQRLQHVNHVKEGGPRNEWKLKYASAPGGVQIRCNACDYYTNSAHKLQLHSAAGRHDAGVALLKHLQDRCSSLQPNQPRVYHCSLCGFSATNRLPLLQHVRSLKHLHMEQLHQLQRRAEGKETSPEIGEVFHVVPGPIDQNQQHRQSPDRRDSVASDLSQLDSNQVKSEPTDMEETNHIDSNPGSHMCPYCDYSSDSEMRIQAHVLAQHGPNHPSLQQQEQSAIHCPLCQDLFKDRATLERHVMQVHSVNSEGLQRLLMLVDQSHWLNQTSRTSTPINPGPAVQNQISPTSVSSKDSSKLEKSDGSNNDENRDLLSPNSDETAENESERCSICFKTFRNVDELCLHQNETGHQLEVKQTPSGPGYVCWKKGCNQFFPTAHTLQMHFKEVHARNSIANMSVSEKHVYKYRCNQCSLAFKTLEKLQLHSQYHMIRDATKCVLCGRSFRSLVALHKHVESVHSELTDEELNAYKQSLMNNPLLLAGLQGQILDSNTNDLLKKESLREENESNTECDETKDLSTSQSLDESNQNDGENSDDSIVYKDQQFLEDYLNSQAMAEDSYNDPNRKYKCHRCRVAFTRQSYLTAHNKTLLHRKGEKLTYPMEKYLDPNRPYKCDVCKESFTQKNILLVHYNSVSHLHKLKRAMQEQANNNNNSPVSPIIGTTQAQNLSMTPKSTASEDDDKKKYRCNICKVAYTQGSTLDIHMRSVLHQTRASKLQDLAMSGQIDLSRPLIEQPDVIQSPKQPSPTPSGGEAIKQPCPTPPSPSGMPGSQGMNCLKCGSSFATQDQLAAHQVYCLFATPMAVLHAGNNDEISEESKAMTGKKGSPIYKHLLEGYGFDLVMQYNESHQRRQRQAEKEKAEAELKMRESKEEVCAEEDVPEPQQEVCEIPELKEEKYEEPEKQNCDEKDEEVSSLPEVSKSTCQTCNKEFSSVWVLKSHCEEVHKDLVPLEYLEKYAQQLKNEIEKKTVVVTAATSSTTNAAPQITTPTSASDRTSPTTEVATPEKDADESKEGLHVKLNLQNPTEPTSTAPSTPTSSTTPASSTESLPANIQAMLAQTMAQNPMALAQQMSEMQAALNVMQLQQLQQFNPVMQMMGMGLPLGLNALAAMNLQPPLVPLMMPPPPFDPMSQFGGQDQQSMMAKQQAAMLQQQAVANAAANQKRARTRITDDQLKILRAHFDINNSPSEDQIHEMANQSGLPPKVIKHWFRNTLFKERQRNKDSPYNFNNPPSTTLNLEEYEKTGEAKVMPLNSSSGSSSDETNKSKESISPIQMHLQTPEIKKEIKEEPSDEQHHQKFEIQKPHNESLEERAQSFFNLPPNLQPPQSPATSVASTESINVSSQPTTPNNLSLTSIIASQLGDTLTTSTPTLNLAGMSSHHGLTSPMLPPPKINQQNFPNPNNLQGMLPMTPNRCLSPNRDFNSQGSNGSTGKRANRTRFTDYQIKVLQEFFENNAYPKDDDLEYLSKLLNLSPRVIVVWFQNARQKARKVYENQPAVEPAPGIDESGANRFQRTPGLNYQCKKCLLVFQRYYELIRHQKTHCFKEEDAKRSAQAQAAAAQIAAVLSSEDSNSSTTVEPNHHQQQQMQNQPQNLMTTSNQSSSIQAMSPTQPAAPTTPTPSQGNFPSTSPTPSETKEGTFQCDKCNLVFPRFELWREHQLVHLMNPNLFPSYPPDSPFGILQQHAQLQQLNANLGDISKQNNQMQGNQNVPHPLINMLNNVTGQKRKMEEFGDAESDTSDQPKDKRLRTTILPEQLDYLYQKYQIESNPSRKMLENIAREVGLKKRVVQVWFQNTRARERKGQFRAHAQVINKRCPFCPALFKVKSALESHLTTKHADQCARGEINIDALPDEEVSLESAPSLSGGSENKFQQQNPNLMPSLFPALHPDMENSIKKYYEESMKRYINELQHHATSSNGDKSEIKTEKGEGGEIPLDLSKPVDLSRPMKVSMEHGGLCDPGPLTDLSERSLCDEREHEQEQSDTMSETTEYIDDESNPTSPASSTQSNTQRLNSSGGSQTGNKRYRTQMSSVQVKIMKSLFHDYKTPTMAECESLGKEIGLPKRVIQVWFQNARAKEKKGKIALQKVLGQTENENPLLPEDCKYCNFKYSHKYSIQDHIFTKSHIANVRVHIESQQNKDCQEGNEFQVPQLPAGPGTISADSTTNLQGANSHNMQHSPSQQQNQLNNNTHLQLLQMAGMQVPNTKAAEQEESPESLFQQLYALGNNSNFGVQNQYVHHAMFGANAYESTPCDYGPILTSVGQAEPEDCF